MGGAYVSCGSFDGNDKSCSAIQIVLEDLATDASGPELEAIRRIERLLEGASDHVEIATHEAELLRSLVTRYRARIAAQIAPVTDPLEQIERDYQGNPGLEPTEAKYGKGLGWE